MAPTHVSQDHSRCTWLSPGNGAPTTSIQERHPPEADVVDEGDRQSAAAAPASTFTGPAASRSTRTSSSPVIRRCSASAT